MSDEKENILESLLSAVKSRFGNPLIGSFIISWVVTNWRFLAVLVAGDTPMEAKIALLEASYMPITKMVIVPLVAAFALSLGYPYLDNIIDKIRRRPLRKAERERIDDEIHSIRLRKELSQENLAYIEVKKEVEEQAALSDPELEVAKANVEFAEQYIKDVEGRKSFLDETRYKNDSEYAHNELDHARRHLLKLRTDAARTVLKTEPTHEAQPKVETQKVRPKTQVTGDKK